MSVTERVSYTVLIQADGCLVARAVGSLPLVEAERRMREFILGVRPEEVTSCFGSAAVTAALDRCTADAASAPAGGQ